MAEHWSDKPHLPLFGRPAGNVPSKASPENLKVADRGLGASSARLDIERTGRGWRMPGKILLESAPGASEFD